MAHDSDDTLTTTPPIQHRYLLVLHIAVYRDADGVRWTDRLWYKDLIEHVVYINNFTLACPCIDVDTPPSDQVKVDDARVQFVDLPGRRKLTLGLLSTASRIWRAVGQADVVHTGLGGWLPVSLGNLTLMAATLRKRFVFVNIESSPWRLVPGVRASWLEKLKAGVAEWVNRRWIERADLAIFTQARYKQTLMTRHLDRGHVIHASWIDAAIIASPAQAEKSWADKFSGGRTHLKILFAGRVNAAKGITVLLEAMHELDARGLAIELHIIGEGELLGACENTRATLKSVRIKLVDSIPYGPEFFSFLRGYEAVVVPSVTDEQPRIVYDAYSQAVPVLASNTDGLRDCVEDGVTGRLCQPNDALALASLIEWAAVDPLRLKALGLAGLARSHQMTHQQMHRRRLKLLDTYLHDVPLQTGR